MFICKISSIQNFGCLFFSITVPVCFLHLSPEFNSIARNAQLYTMDGRMFPCPYYFVNFHPNNYIIFDSFLPASPLPHQICKHLRMAQMRVLASQLLLICRISTTENFRYLVILTLGHPCFDPLTSSFQD